MDALLNMRMAVDLQDMELDEEIAKALPGSQPISAYFEVVLDYESGTWEQLAQSCRHVGLHEEYLPDLYLRSVRWVSEVLAEIPVASHWASYFVFPQILPQLSETHSWPQARRNKWRSAAGLLELPAAILPHSLKPAGAGAAFFGTVQRHHHGDGDQATGLFRQAGARPDFRPRRSA